MIPKNLQAIVNNLKNTKWLQPLLQVSDVYVVGGSVRDAFLGKEMKDIDLIVEGMSLSKIQDMISTFGKVDIVGESFSVIKFTPKGFKGEPFDIAVPRMDRKIGSGHKGFEIITDGVNIFTDLKRRDFTINSMAVEIKTGKLLDLFDGQGDIERGLLRATDAKAFVEDPLRILRGIQFAARFGFKFAPVTMKLMQDNAHLIKEITGERIFDEFVKVIDKKGNTDVALSLMKQSGIDKALFDKEMLDYPEGVGMMDKASFFYVLGLLGDVDPANFLKKRLKGDNELVGDVRTLNNIITKLPTLNDEEDLRFFLFTSFNKSPKVMDADALPQELDDIVHEFKMKNIPMTPKDIAITGDDIMFMGNLKEGPEVGAITEKIQRDALMNRFNFANRQDSLEYLENLLN